MRERRLGANRGRVDTEKPPSGAGGGGGGGLTRDGHDASEMDAYCAWERVHVSGDMGGRSYCSSCDCITYSYFLISVLLFALGTVLSVFSFGAYDDTAFANLGHMWMVGPMCVCSAVMIAIRNVLYLRRRRILDTVVRQRIQVTRRNAGSRGLRDGFFFFLLTPIFRFPGRPVAATVDGHDATTVLVADTHGKRNHITAAIRTVGRQCRRRRKRPTASVVRRSHSRCVKRSGQK